MVKYSDMAQKTWNPFYDFRYSFNMKSDLQDYALLLVTYIYRDNPIKKKIYVPYSSGINRNNYLSHVNKIIEKEIENGSLLDYSERYLTNPMANHSVVYDVKGDEIPYTEYVDMYQNTNQTTNQFFDQPNNYSYNNNGQGQQTREFHFNINSDSDYVQPQTQTMYNANNQYGAGQGYGNGYNQTNAYLNPNTIYQNYQQNAQASYPGQNNMNNQMFNQVNSGTNYYNPFQANPNFYNPNQYGAGYGNNSYFFNQGMMGYPSYDMYNSTNPGLNLPMGMGGQQQYYNYMNPYAYRNVNTQLPMMLPNNPMMYPNMNQMPNPQMMQQSPYTSWPNFNNQFNNENYVYRDRKMRAKTFFSVYKKQIIITLLILAFLGLILGLTIPLFVLYGNKGKSSISMNISAMKYIANYFLNLIK